MMRTLVTGTLLAVGCKVIDIGIVPTPTVEIAVNDQDADGGIAISASHNPIEWNALKLIGARGMFLTPKQMDEVLEIVKTGTPIFASWDRLGKAQYYDHAVQNHIERILELEYLDLHKLRDRRFRVVIDCVNGAGGVIGPLLLRELGCEVIVINEEAHGVFPRNPEPTVDNLKALEEAVLEYKADIGFAVDPDVDRLAMVSEKGKAIGEELTLAIATELILSHKIGPVVVNASTTMAIDDIAKRYGAECYRTKIGEIHVSTKMAEIDAVVGGEGNGGVIVPEIHLGRDATTGVALALQFLLEKGKPLSEGVAGLPQYVMRKDKFELKGIEPESILRRIMKDHAKDTVDTTDGVKIILKEAWIHFRKSNTEPVLRVIAEAKDTSAVNALIQSFTSYFK